MLTKSQNANPSLRLAHAGLIGKLTIATNRKDAKAIKRLTAEIKSLEQKQ